MPYATLEEMTHRVGEDFLYTIADRNNDDRVDMTAVEHALSDASGLMDSYLSTRYPLPLMHFPDLLKRLCVDIAVYWLAQNGGGTTEEKRQRYEDAVAWLERLAQGKAELPVTDSETTTPTGTEGACSHSHTRLFSRHQLRAFLMAGVGASLELRGIERLNPLLDRLGGIDPQQVLSVLGNLVEKQTVDRFIDEKESPDGDKWPEWSPRYAKSRHRHQDLLQSSEDLIDSIQSVFGFGRTDIGTHLMYAARHQFGDTKRGIPQREFLGISADNLVELQNTLSEMTHQSNSIPGLFKPAPYFIPFRQLFRLSPDVFMAMILVK